VVATPIGNRADLSERARAVLSEVALVLAEDTRRTRPMLRDLGIGTPVSALHDHNERERTPGLIERLREGDSVALVSDAGTPLISDPGFILVRAVRAAGLRVSPVPGPSAVVAALSVAGIAADRFAFEGFLPSKATARRKALEALRPEPRTLVFYEAVHRVRDTLSDLAAVLGGGRRACIARELTKLHETVRDGTLDELAAWAAVDEQVTRGEIVLVIEGSDGAAQSPMDPYVLVAALAEELPAGKAAAIAAKLTDEPRKRLYQWLLDRR
jgi:16S rRNA (cytidine1402-2'-O)-methyltransferase